MSCNPCSGCVAQCNNSVVSNRSKVKKLFLVVGGSIFGLVLAVGVYGYSKVMESASFEFMREARQDGFWAPIISGNPEVDRFYFIESDFEGVVRAARLELSLDLGWKEEAWPEGNIALFTDGLASVWIEPMSVMGHATSVSIRRDATKPEEILGTTFEWIPDRYAEFRK